MGDDGHMGEEDFAVLEDVAYELFGDAVDPRELYDVISKQNDASEMHVNAPLTLKEKRKRKRQAQVGLASNVVGLGAGVAATYAAAKNPALRVKPTNRYSGFHEAPKGGPITSRLSRFVKSPHGRARLYQLGAGGALALQAGNNAGDVVANMVLNREAKKKLPTDLKYRDGVKKALDDIVDARRRGVINTDTAIDMAGTLLDSVDKALGADKDKDGIINEASKIVPKTTLKMKKIAPMKAPKKAQPAVQAPAPVPVMKSEEPVLTWSGDISKMDTDKRQVFGFCTVTHINGEPVVDLQGDYVPLEEIEKAAYTYVVNSRKGGDMHERDGEQPLHTSDMIESVIITPEKLAQWGLAEDAMPYGWWVGFKVNDDAQWEKVKKSERTGFSIHGSGKRVEKAL